MVQPKLHEIIVSIIRNSDVLLSVSDITKIIKKNKLWTRPKDGNFPEADQISARVNNYKHLFNRENGIITLVENQLEKRLLRITWNDNLWETPSGHEWSITNQDKTDVAFENKFGFGGEEWLFNLRYNVDGYQYGYIRGLYEVTNIDFIHEAYLFSIDTETKDRLLIAILRKVELIDPDNPPKKIKTKFDLYKSEMVKELKKVNADYKAISYENFLPFVKFKLSEATIFDKPLLINELKEGRKFNRFKPYHIDGDLQKLLDDLIKDKPFIFLPGKRKICVNGHTRIIKPHTKEIEGVHNSISKELEKFLSPNFSLEKKNISIEKTTFGNNIADMVLMNSDDNYSIIEIKTSNNVRYNIREALGQLIDYALWHKGFNVSEIIIVAPTPLNKEHAEYFNRIRKSINIKLSYWQYNKDDPKQRFVIYNGK